MVLVGPAVSPRSWKPRRSQGVLVQVACCFPAELGSLAESLLPNDQNKDFGKRLCESSQSRELGHTVVNLASNTLEREFPDKNNITEP